MAYLSREVCDACTQQLRSVLPKGMQCLHCVQRPQWSAYKLVIWQAS